MESNFIKERTVIRQQIIKKNIQSEKKGKDDTPSTSKIVIKNPPKRIVAFEELVNDNLKQDLADVSKRVDRVCETLAEYLKIKAALKVFKINPRNVRVQTNLGCNFYAQCQIEDASKIYLDIGQGYFLLMGLDEALEMIDRKEKQWMQQLDQLQERASKLKAYIKIALEAMGRLYELESEKLSEQK